LESDPRGLGLGPSMLGPKIGLGVGPCPDLMWYVFGSLRVQTQEGLSLGTSMSGANMSWGWGGGPDPTVFGFGSFGLGFGVEFDPRGLGLGHPCQDPK
jgi:hypothetical protein